LVVASHEAAVAQIEQLVNPLLDLRLLEVLWAQSGRILPTLILIRDVYPSLTRHHSSGEEVLDHPWSVQARPVDQAHQL